MAAVGWQLPGAVGWHMPGAVVSVYTPIGGLVQVVGWLEHQAQEAAHMWCLEHGISHAGLIKAYGWVDQFLAALGIGPFSVTAAFVRAGLDSVADDYAAGKVAAVSYAHAVYRCLPPDISCPPPGMGTHPRRRAEYEGLHGSGLKCMKVSFLSRSGSVHSDLSAQSGSIVSATSSRDATGHTAGSTWTTRTQTDADDSDAGLLDETDDEHARNGSTGSNGGETRKRHQRACRGNTSSYSEC
jgi:hypothetical protein